MSPCKTIASMAIALGLKWRSLDHICATKHVLSAKLQTSTNLLEQFLHTVQLNYVTC